MPGGLYKYPELIRATWTVFHPPTPFSLTGCLLFTLKSRLNFALFVPERLPPTFPLLTVSVQKHITESHMHTPELSRLRLSSVGGGPKRKVYIMLDRSGRSDVNCSYCDIHTICNIKTTMNEHQQQVISINRIHILMLPCQFTVYSDLFWQNLYYLKHNRDIVSISLSSLFCSTAQFLVSCALPCCCSWWDLSMWYAVPERNLNKKKHEVGREEVFGMAPKSSP